MTISKKQIKEEKIKLLEDTQDKICSQFLVLHNYFDYFEDDISSEPIRAVRAIQKTVNEIFDSKIKALREGRENA